MGKKRVTYDILNEDNKPPNHIVNDHHHQHRHHQHQHHHHRHQNRQKSKKIKPEAKLLHTLNSHLKKIAKSRSRKTISLSIKGLHGNNRQNHVHLSSWLKNNDDIDHYQHYDNWFMGFKFEHDHHNVYFDNNGGDEMGVFEFEQELLCWQKMTFNEDDHFGWDCVFGPDLNARHNNLVFVFEEDGFIFGSIPDPGMNFEGMYICDVWELSSQEDMINEFIKVNLFVS